MAKRDILVGSVDQHIDIFIQDSASAVGAGKTGLVYNSAGLTCYYRKGLTGSMTALTLATLANAGAAHSDGGFVEIDATNAPGMYRLDLSDTIVASVGSVSLMLKGASGMAPVPIELNVYDNLDVAALVWGATLPGSYTGSQAGNVLDSVLADTAEIGTAGAGLTAVALTTAERNAIADALLARNIAGGSSAGRTVTQALRRLRNRVAVAAGTMSVYDETDAGTASWTAAVSTAAGNPVSEVDPA